MVKQYHYLLSFFYPLSFKGEGMHSQIDQWGNLQRGMSLCFAEGGREVDNNRRAVEHMLRSGAVLANRHYSTLASSKNITVLYVSASWPDAINFFDER